VKFEGSEPVVIHFNPEAIGILQIDLVHVIRPHLGLPGIALPVAIFDLMLVKMFHKSREIGHGEGEVDIDIVGNIGGGAADHMELHMVAEIEPGVAAIVEGFGNGVEKHDPSIEIPGPGQVGDVDSRVIYMWFWLGHGNSKR
jgi:hypothetical protein